MGVHLLSRFSRAVSGFELATMVDSGVDCYIQYIKNMIYCGQQAVTESRFTYYTD